MDQSPDLIKFTDNVFFKNANFDSNMAPYRKSSLSIPSIPFVFTGC